MIRSDMLNRYTQKIKYLNSPTSSNFPSQSDFETKLHQILCFFLEGPISSTRSQPPTKYRTGKKSNYRRYVVFSGPNIGGFKEHFKEIWQY